MIQLIDGDTWRFAMTPIACETVALAISNTKEPDTLFFKITRAERKAETFQVFYNAQVTSGVVRSTLTTYQQLFRRNFMNDITDKISYYEIENHENVALGYFEWEGSDKTDKSYYNDYIIISLRNAVTREGCIGYNDAGKPYYRLARGKAKVCKTIEEAHERMVEAIRGKMILDELGE